MTDYPLRLSVDYPDGPRDRISVLFRPLLVIPIYIVYAVIVGASVRVGFVGGAAGVFVAVALMIVFRQKYPRWWFDFLLQVVRFGTRVGGYALLWRDEYPSTDEEQAVHLDLYYPDAAQLNRWLPLVKWLLAIPHYIVLALLGIAMIVVTVVAWIVILFTGQHPRSLFDFTVGVQRYGLRVGAYAFYLVTDRYPPFSLS
jgi:hypothetical protein